MCSCDDTVSVETNERYYIKIDGHPELSFILVGEYEPMRPINIIYNEKTKVLYSVSMGSHNSGNLTELHDENGMPLLYNDTNE